jgi:arylsulfatase A-like enzyme
VRRQTILIGILILLVLGVLATQIKIPPAKPKHNLLLITVDTLRPDHLGCYGYPRDTSPAIDSLAADGVRFTQAHAQRGLTWPSLASILTGQNPITHGVRNNGMPLNDDQVSLATELESRGVLCVALIANAPQANWRGFDPLTHIRGEELTEAALAQLDTLKNDRFFLWLHYVAPHAPYEPDARYLDRFDPDYTGTIDGSLDTLYGITQNKTEVSEADLSHIVSLYDGEIAFVDDQVKRVLDKLTQQGILDDTLIVFSSDHGEDLYEHNYYFDHMASVYDSSLRIPLILRLPGKVPAAKTIDSLVRSIDIAPTIYRILGLRAPEGIEGGDLTPLFKGDQPKLGPSFGEWMDRIVTVRTDTHKYIWNPLDYHPVYIPMKEEPPEGTPLPLYPIATRELYDIKADPNEQHNLIDTHPEIADKLHVIMEEWIKKSGWKLEEFPTIRIEAGSEVREHVQIEIDDEVREQLEAMGYVI